MKTAFNKNVVVVVVIVLSLLMGACSNNGPEKAATEFLDALKSNGTETFANIYYGDTDTANYISEITSLLSETEELKAVGSLLAETLWDFDYEVLDISQNDSHATVDVKIITEDWAKIIPGITDEYLPIAFKMILSGDSEEKLIKEFAKVIKEQRKQSEDIEFKTSIPVILDGEEWKIDASYPVSDLEKAITGLS